MLLGIMPNTCDYAMFLSIPGKRHAMLSKTDQPMDQTRVLPESPDEQKEDHETKTSKGTVLLQEQFPIDPDSGALVLERIVPEPGRHISCDRVSSV